ncbi:MAG: tetratricopeptide repeat protein [Planctomycetota bacterium]|nr:tetratricopeptide repeat protein [Planctomycetota bacterium]
MAVSDLKNKGLDALKRKRYELAMEALQEYLKFQADDGEAMDAFFTAAEKQREVAGKSLFGGFLSKASIGGKDPVKRMASCLRALAKNPTDKKVLMSLGSAALEANAFESASVAYRMASAVDPEDNEPWKRMGEALGKAGRIREALDALGEAVRIDRRDQEAQKLRKNLAAEGALKISGFETAKSSRDLIKDKDVAQELEMEARLQLTPEHAASELEKVKAGSEAAPDDARLRIRMADLLLQQHDEVGALRELDHALGLDPANYELSVRIGDLRLGQFTRAYKAARDSGDESAVKTTHAALVEASLAEYGRRVQEHPLDLGERFRLGRWLLQAGNVDQALAEFQQTVRDPARKVDSLQLQARCFEQKNIMTLAAKKLEEAVAEFPTLASPKAKAVFYDYADLLERSGNADEARAIFERIVEEDAAYKDVLTRLSALSA